MLGVPSSEPLWTDGPNYHQASEIAEALDSKDWRRLSAGNGSKGPRLHDWALRELWRLQLTEEERAEQECEHRARERQQVHRCRTRRAGEHGDPHQPVNPRKGLLVERSLRAP